MDNTDQLSIHNVEGGSLLAVKAVAGASRDAIVGVLGESLKIATSAPPEKGKANAALARTLARFLSISTRSVALAAGQSSARKEFFVRGLTASALRSALADL